MTSKVSYGNLPGNRVGCAIRVARAIAGVRLSIGLLVLVSCFLTGCGSSENVKDDAAQEGIEKTFDRGPVQVILRIDKEEPTIADRIQLSLEVTADEDYEVRMPRFGDKLEQFGIVDYDTTQPELIEDNKTRQSRSYVLEPFLSGDYIIPVMKFQFSKKGEEDATQHELETEAITLHVKSLRPEAAAELQIHDIAPPEELPREAASRSWLVWGGAVLVLGVVGAVLLSRRRKGGKIFQPVIPAHEVAFQQLEALVAENLPEKHAIKEFYQRVSDILRHYIENRFGLQAPEQTTEEFLGTLAVTRILTPPQKQLLREFLRHCDLVKFAEHQPATEDIQKTFDSCKNFILETRDIAEPGGTAHETSGNPNRNVETTATV